MNIKKHVSLTILICISLSIKAQSSIALIETHFNAIVKTEKYRNYRNVATLDSVASYIKLQFEQYADETYYQPFMVDGKEYRNVVAVFGKENTETIVVGAHYDVCGNQDGADDNASGVIGLLEMARMLKGQSLKYRIELVGFTLEEPPFFRTEHMGSYHHAESLFNEGRNVYGMLSLDMIGYFSSEKHTQNFPIKLLSWFYGNTGDFILIANKWGKGTFARKFSRKLKKQNLIKVKELSGPKAIEGIDWSDHLNYWHFGFSASLITDTAGNRNKNYHNKGDVISTINLLEMSKSIDVIYGALISLK